MVYIVHNELKILCINAFENRNFLLWIFDVVGIVYSS